MKGFVLRSALAATLSSAVLAGCGGARSDVSDTSSEDGGLTSNERHLEKFVELYTRLSSLLVLEEQGWTKRPEFFSASETKFLRRHPDPRVRSEAYSAKGGHRTVTPEVAHALTQLRAAVDLDRASLVEGLGPETRASIKYSRLVAEFDVVLSQIRRDADAEDNLQLLGMCENTIEFLRRHATIKVGGRGEELDGIVGALADVMFKSESRLIRPGQYATSEDQRVTVRGHFKWLADQADGAKAALVLEQNDAVGSMMWKGTAKQQYVWYFKNLDYKRRANYELGLSRVEGSDFFSVLVPYDIMKRYVGPSGKIVGDVPARFAAILAEEKQALLALAKQDTSPTKAVYKVIAAILMRLSATSEAPAEVMAVADEGLKMTLRL